jgi:hypothetical protein
MFRKYFEGLEIRVQEKFGFPTKHQHFKHHYERGYWLITMKLTPEHPFSAPRTFTCKVVRPTKACTPVTRYFLSGRYKEVEDHMVLLDVDYTLVRKDNQTYDKLMFRLRSLQHGKKEAFGLLLPYTPKHALLPPPTT